jgi:hypothetical protein
MVGISFGWKDKVVESERKKTEQNLVELSQELKDTEYRIRGKELFPVVKTNIIRRILVENEILITKEAFDLILELPTAIEVAQEIALNPIFKTKIIEKQDVLLVLYYRKQIFGLL